jgi:hypothetical protein
MISLGAPSIGSFDQGFIQNTPDTGKWRNAIGKGRFATSRDVDFIPLLHKWDMSATLMMPAFVRLCGLECDGFVRHKGSALTVT